MALPAKACNCRVFMKKGCLSVIIVVVLIAAVVIGGAIYLTGSPKQLGVTPTDNDFKSAMDKTKVKIDDITVLNAGNMLSGNFKTKGSVKADLALSGAEVTSLAAKAHIETSPIKDVQFKFLDNNKMEMGFKLSDKAIDFLRKNAIISGFYKLNPSGYALLSPLAASSVNDFLINYLTGLVNSKPIYARGKLERTSPNTLNVSIETITVGRVPLPQSTVKTVEKYTIEIVNNIISNEHGFSIEELRIEGGQLYYKGTLPAEISGTEIK